MVMERYPARSMVWPTSPDAMACAGACRVFPGRSGGSDAAASAPGDGSRAGWPVNDLAAAPNPLIAGIATAGLAEAARPVRPPLSRVGPGAHLRPSVSQVKTARSLLPHLAS
jgi:hypothetical protein